MISGSPAVPSGSSTSFSLSDPATTSPATNCRSRHQTTEAKVLPRLPERKPKENGHGRALHVPHLAEWTVAWHVNQTTGLVDGTVNDPALRRRMLTRLAACSWFHSSTWSTGTVLDLPASSKGRTGTAGPADPISLRSCRFRRRARKRYAVWYVTSRSSVESITAGVRSALPDVILAVGIRVERPVVDVHDPPDVGCMYDTPGHASCPPASLVLVCRRVLHGRNDVQKPKVAGTVEVPL